MCIKVAEWTVELAMPIDTFLNTFNNYSQVSIIARSTPVNSLFRVFIDILMPSFSLSLKFQVFNVIVGHLMDCVHPAYSPL
jgi:hypothetical protein